MVNANGSSSSIKHNFMSHEGNSCNYFSCEWISCHDLLSISRRLHDTVSDRADRAGNTSFITKTSRFPLKSQNLYWSATKLVFFHPNPFLGNKDKGPCSNCSVYIAGLLHVPGHRWPVVSGHWSAWSYWNVVGMLEAWGFCTAFHCVVTVLLPALHVNNIMASGCQTSSPGTLYHINTRFSL